MILSLLDISRIETGQLAIERMPVDVCALVSRIVDEVRVTLGEREIEVQCPNHPLMIQGDELRLEQVVQNLIQNALKYSALNTPIHIAVSEYEAAVRIDVHDIGIGIPQADLPQLFDRFYRAGNVDSRNISGLGIGLYVVKQIVELHGGYITVESTEHQGSTFTVTLPLDTQGP